MARLVTNESVAPQARKLLAPAELEILAKEFNRAYFDKCLESQEGTLELYRAIDRCIIDRDRYYVRNEQHDVDNAI